MLSTGIIAALAKDPNARLSVAEKFTQQDAAKMGELAAEQFMNTYGEFLSLFDLQGPYGVWSAMQLYIERNDTIPEVAAAFIAGDRQGFISAILKTQEIAFVQLFEKGAFDRLQLVETLSLENLKEYARMRQDAGITDQAAPVAQEVVAGPVATETPIEKCAREFHELPSSAWKKKWFNNQTNRSIADKCVAEGRI